MPFIPVPNTVQAELRFLQDAQRVENVLHFGNASGWTGGSMLTLANSLLAWWTAEYKPQQVNTVTLREIYITDLTTSTSATVSLPVTTGNTGGSANPAAPNNVTLCCTLRTAARGRTARGRFYFIGLQKGDITDNTVASARVAAIQGMLNALVAGTYGNPGVLAVASRYENKVPRTSGIYRIVTSAVCVDATVDSQRRRLPKRGQ